MGRQKKILRQNIGEIQLNAYAKLLIPKMKG